MICPEPLCSVPLSSAGIISNQFSDMPGDCGPVLGLQSVSVSDQQRNCQGDGSGLSPAMSKQDTIHEVKLINACLSYCKPAIVEALFAQKL